MTLARHCGLGGMAWIAICGWSAAALADAKDDELRQRVYRHALAGEEEAALPVARELLAATEKAFGADHLETAASLDALGDRLQPDAVAMRINLANALAKTERFAEAEKHCRKAIEMAPGNAALHNNLGVMLFEQGSREEAVAEFRKALAIDPNLRDAREGLETAERESSRKEAAESP